MKQLVLLLTLFLLSAPAWADSVLCATGSHTATTPQTLPDTCVPGQTYGINTSSTATYFLNGDGNRNCILVQNPLTNSANVCIGWGGTIASLTAPQNCYTLAPGAPMYQFNLPVANSNGRVPGSAFSVISSTASSIVYSFCQ